MATAETRLQKPEFVNEAFIDFTKAENRAAMEAALKKVAAEFASANRKTRAVIESNLEAIQRLGNLSGLGVVVGKLAEGGGGMRSTAEFDLRIPYAEETVDVAAELLRLKKEIEGLQKAIASKEKQLGNETFRSRAPEKIIREMEEVLAGQRVELGKMVGRKAQLEG